MALNGKAPFKLTLNIKNLATSESRIAVVDVLTHEWKVDVPTHKLQTVGTHLITIESFEDSSPCSPSAVDYERRTFRIDVAETAAIVPFDRREDWCVGDILQFQLEGNAPWRVECVFSHHHQVNYPVLMLSPNLIAIDSTGKLFLQRPRFPNSVVLLRRPDYSRSPEWHISKPPAKAKCRM